MGFTESTKRPGDESYRGVDINDFSLGLLSDIDALDIPINGSPNCENVKPRQGSCDGRAGWRRLCTVVAGTTTQPDGLAAFVDSSGTWHIVCWHGGNVYRATTAGVVSTVGTSVYASGNHIAHTDYSNDLFWSDGTTIWTSGPNSSGLRKYDGSTDAMVVSSGAVGSIEPPAAKVMATYAGQIVLGNCKLVGGTLEPHIIRPSNVNDATTFLSSLAQNVAPGVGGEINSIIPFSVSTEGLDLSRTLFIGKSAGKVFGMQGAMGSLVENVINIDAGVLDGLAASFIPGPNGQSGVVIFPGTDYQVYVTNGVTADSLTKDKCSEEIAAYINDRRAGGGTVKFTCIRNAVDSQYILDLGGDKQYCYDYKRKNWTRYRGWPSGFLCRAEDSIQRQMLFSACLYDGDLIIAELNRGLDDNGTAIEPFWATPKLRGDVGESGQNAGDGSLLKMWGPLFIDVSTDEGGFSAELETDHGEGQTATASFTITPSSTATAVARYGSATYGTTFTYSGTLTPTFRSYSRRLGVAKQTTGKPPEHLKGGICQITVSQTTSGKIFRLQGIRIKYILRGMFGATRRGN